MPWPKGRPRSAATKEKISKGMMGRVVSDETRDKQRASSPGKPVRNESRTEEQRAKSRKNMATYRMNNPKRVRKNLREWYENGGGREWSMDYQMRKAYGIGLSEYESMFASQNGLCAICERPERRTYRGRICRLAIDHDHVTQKIRALLCSSCNTAIGLLNDDPKLLVLAATYVTEHRHGF